MCQTREQFAVVPNDSIVDSVEAPVVTERRRGYPNNRQGTYFHWREVSVGENGADDERKWTLMKRWIARRGWISERKSCKSSYVPTYQRTYVRTYLRTYLLTYIPTYLLPTTNSATTYYCLLSPAFTHYHQLPPTTTYTTTNLPPSCAKLTPNLPTTHHQESQKQLRNLNECPDIPQDMREVLREEWQQQELQDIEQRRNDPMPEH